MTHIPGFALLVALLFAVSASTPFAPRIAGAEPSSAPSSVSLEQPMAVGGFAPLWSELGSQTVTGESWNFDSQAFMDPSQTFIRVRAGGCEGEAGAFTIEGNLHQQDPEGLGLDVWAGPLHLVGSAAGVGSAVGHARLSRPVTLNPITQIDVTLFGLTGVLRGADLFVCARTP